MSATAARAERYRFTAAEVLAMIEAGLLTAAEDYELLDGELIHVTAKGPLHRIIATALNGRLIRALPSGLHAQKEECVVGEEHSLPEPDVAIVRGRLHDYVHHLPEGKDLLLAVEVSVTTLARDRDKLPLYARAGIPTVWILDVVGRQLDVHTASDGERYTAVRTFQEHEQVDVPGIGERWTVASILDGAEP